MSHAQRKSGFKSFFAQDQFYALSARLDRMENRLEIHVNRVIDDANHGNKPKTLRARGIIFRSIFVQVVDSN